MIDKIKGFISQLNEKGVPLPMLRDPKTGMPSVSLTMLFISFNVVLIGLMGKLAGFFGGVDVQQAIYWNVLTSSLYFGRTLSYKGTEVKNEENK